MSFSVGTAAYQSSDLSSYVDQSEEDDWSVGGGVTVEGIGIMLDADWSFSNDASQSSDAYRAQSGSRSVSFSLSDPDLGDAFDVAIRRDRVYGAPVFSILAGKSRCVYENATVPRDDISMEPVMMNLGLYAAQTATLVINNAAPLNETFSWYLNVAMETNLAGLIVSASGVVLQHNAVLLTIPPGPTYVALTVTTSPQFSSLYNHTGDSVTMVLTLTGVCYGDVVSANNYAYTTSTTLKVNYIYTQASRLLPVHHFLDRVLDALDKARQLLSSPAFSAVQLVLVAVVLGLAQLCYTSRSSTKWAMKALLAKRVNGASV